MRTGDIKLKAIASIPVTLRSSLCISEPSLWESRSLQEGLGMPMIYFLLPVCGRSLALALFPSLEIQGENTALIVHMLFSRWGVARRELPSQTTVSTASPSKDASQL